MLKMEFKVFEELLIELDQVDLVTKLSRLFDLSDGELKNLYLVYMGLNPIVVHLSTETIHVIRDEICHRFCVKVG